VPIASVPIQGVIPVSAGLLLCSADVVVILPLGFATCTCGTGVVCPFQLQAPRKLTRTHVWGNLSLYTIFPCLPWPRVRSNP
jgi:hypothetical protein